MSEARDSFVIAENQKQVDRLNRLGWYHSIELPDGAVIQGHQSLEQLRTRLSQFHIPQDLRGKRVLDIGAWDGWFSFEMERRGAHVLALDSARNTRLLEARTLLGSKIDYQIGDICRLTARDVGTFDIVLFLGVLYHLKHPLLALENVCGMCRDMACIESFVTDADPAAVPLMEYYEAAELRGQLDNWCGPNTACLMAFARTAGFARVELESVLGERAHVSGYRHWHAEEGSGLAPQVRCVDNSTTHDHQFSASADDYASLYFTSDQGELSVDNVYSEMGGFGARPIHVADTGGGWQATFKLPPGLSAGWHHARLRVADSAWSTPLRIGVDVKADAVESMGTFALSRVADGASFETNRVRVGENSAISVWAAGISADREISIRLNGTDLPAIWISAPDADGLRQINAILPAGISPGRAQVTLVTPAGESRATQIELHN